MTGLSTRTLLETYDRTHERMENSLALRRAAKVGGPSGYENAFIASDYYARRYQRAQRLAYKVRAKLLIRGIELDALCPAVRAFAQLMEGRLQANEAKGTWAGLPLTHLLRRLEEVVAELRAARGYTEIAHAAADVANFAMMLADNARRRAEEEEGV